MSGHSHAKTIKHQKDLTDKKRGAIFSKVSRLISVAVKEGGPNPENNTRLRMAMEAAKNANMPKDNVDRAIQRAIGSDSEENLQEVSFEAYGPGGISIIIDGITSNTNRALGEVKKILSQNGGKMVGEGAVKWMFDRKGLIVLDPETQPESFKNKEKLEMTAIEAGADDMRWEENNLELYTKIEDLDGVKKKIEEMGLKIDTTALGWISKEEVSLEEKEKKANQKLFEALNESEDVQSVFSNLKT
ncbi:YebC/PmpR family DNA-binding transcriptional regulator [Patescibacteria group bacterium]